jgi:hypothetical protein
VLRSRELGTLDGGSRLGGSRRPMRLVGVWGEEGRRPRVRGQRGGESLATALLPLHKHEGTRYKETLQAGQHLEPR